MHDICFNPKMTNLPNTQIKIFFMKLILWTKIKTDTEEKTCLYCKNILVYHKVKVEHRCHMDYFNDVFTTFRTLNKSVFCLYLYIGFHEK